MASVASPLAAYREQTSLRVWAEEAEHLEGVSVEGRVAYIYEKVRLAVQGDEEARVAFERLGKEVQDGSCPNAAEALAHCVAMASVDPAAIQAGLVVETADGVRRLEAKLAKFDPLLNRLASDRFSVTRSPSTSIALKGKLRLQIRASWVINSGLLVDRDDLLEEIDRNFGIKSVQIIQGHKATGKTTLAVAYAAKYGHKYEVVHWIDARSFEQDLLVLADGVGIAAQPKVDERLAALRNWLGEHSKWLLVVDNIEPEDCRGVEELDLGGKLLLTTYRGREVANKFTGPAVISSRLFSPEEALLFLTQGSSSEGERDAAAELAKVCGYLPLAIAQIKAYVMATGCSLASYQRLYEENRTKIFTVESSLLPEDPLRMSAVTTWTMSFTEAFKRDPLVKDFLGYLSHLAPHLIEEALLQAWVKKYHPELGGLGINEVIRILRNYGLIERDGVVLKMHPLLQEVAKEYFATDPQYFSQVLAILDQESDLDFKDPRNWVRVEALLPHLELILRRVPVEEQAPVFIDIQTRLGSYFRAKGQLEVARRMREGALDTARKHCHGNLPVLAASLNNLAIVLGSLGELGSAKEMHMEALRIQRTLRGAEASVATSLSNLAGILYKEKDLKDTRRMYEEALAIQLELYGKSHPDVASTRASLANILAEEGKLKQAQAELIDVIKLQVAMYGTEEHLVVASSYEYLARVLQRQHELDEAEKAWRKALNIRKKLYGGNPHFIIAVTLLNLASLLRKKDAEASAAMGDEAESIGRALDVYDRARVSRMKEELFGAAPPVRSELVYRREVLQTGDVRPDYVMLEEDGPWDEIPRCKPCPCWRRRPPRTFSSPPEMRTSSNIKTK